MIVAEQKTEKQLVVPMSITAVILTLNEERHIERVLSSVACIADCFVVVDSGSNDKTIELAKACGAEVLENVWVNHANQFNWALEQLPDDTDWVLRIDADEILTEELATEINKNLASLPPRIAGVFVSRRIHFLGRPIRWGGVFPVRVLRLFKHGNGCCENRWMDEHIVVEGETAEFKSEIVDDNLNSLTWWTEKHNSYASREVVDLLNLEYGFTKHETISGISGAKQSGIKRWIRENFYAKLPIGCRAFAYFFYRYVIRLGFLDGKEGTAFHVLQGFWYRYLVDMKLREVRKHMDQENTDVISAIHNILGIDVQAD